MKNSTDNNQTEVNPLIDQTKANKHNERYVNLVVDDIPYKVTYEPFFFNEQVRYYVTVNAGPQNVFAWDSEIILFRAIDDESGVIPVTLEKAISSHLEHQHLQ